MPSADAIHDLEQRYVTLRRDYEAVVIERDACIPARPNAVRSIVMETDQLQRSVVERPPGPTEPTCLSTIFVDPR